MTDMGGMRGKQFLHFILLRHTSDYPHATSVVNFLGESKRLEETYNPNEVHWDFLCRPNNIKAAPFMVCNNAAILNPWKNPVYFSRFSICYTGSGGCNVFVLHIKYLCGMMEVTCL